MPSASDAEAGDRHHKRDRYFGGGTNEIMNEIISKRMGL